MTVAVPTAVCLQMVARRRDWRSLGASRHGTFWIPAFIALPLVEPPSTLQEFLALNCRVLLEVLAYTTPVALDLHRNGVVFQDEAARAFGVSLVLLSMCQMFLQEIVINLQWENKQLECLH